MWDDGPSRSDIFTVSAITLEIKELLETQLPTVWVEGEISKHTLATSGHRYLTIKDEGAVLDCAIWKNTVRLESRCARNLGQLALHLPGPVPQDLVHRLRSCQRTTSTRRGSTPARSRRSCRRSSGRRFHDSESGRRIPRASGR